MSCIARRHGGSARPARAPDRCAASRATASPPASPCAACSSRTPAPARHAAGDGHVGHPAAAAAPARAPARRAGHGAGSHVHSAGAGTVTSLSPPSSATSTSASRHPPSNTARRNGQVVEQFVGDDHADERRRRQRRPTRAHPARVRRPLRRRHLDRDVPVRSTAARQPSTARASVPGPAPDLDHHEVVGSAEPLELGVDPAAPAPRRTAARPRAR